MLLNKESWLTRQPSDSGGWTITMVPRFAALRFILDSKAHVHEQLDWLAARGYITYEPSLRHKQPIIVHIPAIQPHDGSGYTWGKPGKSPNPKAGTRAQKEKTPVPRTKTKRQPAEPGTAAPVSDTAT